MSAPFDPGSLATLAVGVCSGVGSSSTRRDFLTVRAIEIHRHRATEWYASPIEVDVGSAIETTEGIERGSWRAGTVRLEPGVVQRPRSWLLATGWKRHGLLNAHEIPSRAAA